jgi:hypothetical protein
MSASERLASAVMQGQQHGSIGRRRRRGSISGRDMQKKIAAGAQGHQKMAAARGWQQRWAAEGKVCSGDAGHLNPPPYAEIGKGEERLAAPNQHSDRRDNLPLCAGGTFDPWRGGGVPRSASPAAQLQRRAFFARCRSAAAALCRPHSDSFSLLSYRVVRSDIDLRRYARRMHAAGRRTGRRHDNDGMNDDVALGGGERAAGPIRTWG